MPLIAHNKLPTFDRLRQEGQTILREGQASQQYIRPLHIGLLNMMPDAAIEATERQFLRLIGESNPITQFIVHPFTLDTLPRGKKARQHIANYYENFNAVKQEGLDALIITGANVTEPDLAAESFWEPLTKVIEWAHDNVTSTLCSCLATHAVLQLRHQQRRRHLQQKRWGVYTHHVREQHHPLVHGINTEFDVPHSRFNQVDTKQFETAGLHVLVHSEAAGTHLAVSQDGLRTVYFQGHPEYDNISLLKEYKREIMRYINRETNDYPPFPVNIFNRKTQAILNEYHYLVKESLKNNKAMPEFPEQLILPEIHNSWHDTGAAIMSNWMGLVYQLTNKDRDKPFMDNIDHNNPLGLY